MYEEMGIYQLLFSIRDNNILERIVEEQVGILIAYDQEDDSEMDHLFCFIGKFAFGSFPKEK